MLKTLTLIMQWRTLLLASSLYTILWVHPVQAALLKDIRLGEYNTFTRIVFELDKAPSTIPDISSNPDELRVTFRGITADLVRKIPIKQNPHVSAVQIWTQGDQLSAVFKVDAPFTHSKIRSINDPPRLLMDVKWQAAIPPPVQKDNTPNTASLVLAAPVETTADPLPSEAATDHPALPQATAASEAPAEIVSNDLATDFSSGSEKQLPEASVLMPPASTSPRDENSLGIPSPISDPRPNRLHYYLVIGLVVLTIFILILLVLMLLMKYRWADNRLLFNIDDPLNEQQAKIETINGRIQEQLKHYEKS